MSINCCLVTFKKNTTLDDTLWVALGVNTIPQFSITLLLYNITVSKGPEGLYTIFFII